MELKSFHLGNCEAQRSRPWLTLSSFPSPSSVTNWNHQYYTQTIKSANRIHVWTIRCSLDRTVCTFLGESQPHLPSCELELGLECVLEILSPSIARLESLIHLESPWRTSRTHGNPLRFYICLLWHVPRAATRRAVARAKYSVLHLTMSQNLETHRFLCARGHLRRKKSFHLRVYSSATDLLNAKRTSVWV